jgi:hypothetical protein
MTSHSKKFTQSLRKLSREWDALEECERIRRGSAHWRVTEMNAQYRFCRSYPTHFLVPSYMGDEGVQAMASIRGHTRVPVVTWRDECTGAVRCSSRLSHTISFLSHSSVLLSGAFLHAS